MDYLKFTLINCIVFHSFQVLSELVNCTDQETAEKRIAELSDSITALWDILMGLEMQLVDQLEVFIITLALKIFAP